MKNPLLPANRQDGRHVTDLEAEKEANQRLRDEIGQLQKEKQWETERADRFRDACHKYARGPHLEIRMPGDELDEIVGYGAFHVEQMDDNHWFFKLGSCGFHLHGKRVRLVPLDHDTWAEAKEDLSTKNNVVDAGTSRDDTQDGLCMSETTKQNAGPPRQPCGICLPGELCGHKLPTKDAK